MASMHYQANKLSSKVIQSFIKRLYNMQVCRDMYIMYCHLVINILKDDSWHRIEDVSSL